MKRLAGGAWWRRSCAGNGMEIRNALNAVQVRYHCFCLAVAGGGVPDTEPAT